MGLTFPGVPLNDEVPNYPKKSEPRMTVNALRSSGEGATASIPIHWPFQPSRSACYGGQSDGWVAVLVNRSCLHHSPMAIQSQCQTTP